MSATKTLINETPVWAKLNLHQKSTQYLKMRNLFADNPKRFDEMSEVLGGFLFDYSKNRISEETLNLLIELANTADLSEQMQRMKTGEKINISENRAALHIASRLPENAELWINNENIVPKVQAELSRALSFAEKVRQGEHKTHNNEPFRYVVNIGIGGSDLGVRAMTLALRKYQNSNIRVHFVANVDSADLDAVFSEIEIDKTLFIVSSKSFTTPETLINANTAKKLLLTRLPEKAISQHFIAISNNIQAACDFGIAKEHIFQLNEWVGGRYSATSVIGLPLMIAVGEKNFRQFLAGANAMDEHFFTAEFRHNIPVLAGLIGVWYNTFYRSASHAIIPYAHDLCRFPAHIQQLDMESNGKKTSQYGDYLDFDTGSIIWGEEGVNCQHAFFQLLHQGTRLVPADFIVVVGDKDDIHQQTLVANALAQTRALMAGKTDAETLQELAHLSAIKRDELLPQKRFDGNQPTNTILLDALTPFNLGKLLAMYEHKTFVQAAIWGINPFDQWGVEYGKALAKDIYPKLLNNDNTNYDSSTNGLIAFYRGCE
ncbi:MAG: glucose-6-phosphate isomerase [Neisseriaceae bacterium]|nr:glucose-6-phosphate isomerase [Neisseriaceae bacterium]